MPCESHVWLNALHSQQSEEEKYSGLLLLVVVQPCLNFVKGLTFSDCIQEMRCTMQFQVVYIFSSIRDKKLLGKKFNSETNYSCFFLFLCLLWRIFF